MKREIIEIDRAICDGCGLCAGACAEGALELDGEGKAVLVRDVFCDGLGACLDVCPTGALKVVEREAACFDEGAAKARVSARVAAGPAPSELGQWPIQLHLVSPAAPCFKECDLLVAADCTAFALGSFHADLLKGKSLVIACPKLDRTEGYVEKLAELLASNTVYSVTVAIMEVPCCSGLKRIIEAAVARSGKNIAVRTVVIGLDGRRK
jgi:NAD-dependent dihydropyrimidine dehydrogenase PreA subunit